MACIGSKPERTTMLPGMLSGLGNRTARLGVLPLPANEGAPRVIEKVRITVPSGLPPSMTCSLPASSTTVISLNCNSSFGICNTFCILYGSDEARLGWLSSCACSTGIIELLVVSNEKRTLPYIFSPVTYAVLLATLVTNGTAPMPRALMAGSDRFPPSILFHTTFSTVKFFAAVLL